MASALLDELLAVLEPHAQREELGLFAALADDEDLRHVVPVLLAEHTNLHRPIDRSEAAITAFLDALASHIIREEHAGVSRCDTATPPLRLGLRPGESRVTTELNP